MKGGFEAVVGQSRDEAMSIGEKVAEAVVWLFCCPFTMGQTGIQDSAFKHQNRARQLFLKNIGLQENFGREIQWWVPRRALEFLLYGG